MRPSVFALLLGASLMAGSASVAQAPEADRHTLILRGVPLAEALDRLVQTTGMDLIYGAEVRGATPVFCALENATAETHLRCLVREAGLDFYRLSSGTYVLTERVAQAPARGAFAGIVVDAETGEPLPFANVYLADASVGAAASESGLFALNALLSGPHAVVASYVGYEPARDSVYVPAGGTVRRRLALRAKTLTPSTPVVVDGLQQRLPSELLGEGRLEDPDFRTPGAGPTDATRAAPSLLGVGARQPLADLHLQGSEAGEQRTLLDGMPVFEPLSFGRLFSAFSPLALRRLTIRKAGFGASGGSYLAGAIEGEQAVDADAPEATLASDPYSADLRARSPFRLGTAEGSVMAAARLGLWSVYRPSALDDAIRDWNRVDPLLTSVWLESPATADVLIPHRHGSDVAYSDLHGAVRLRFGAFRLLYASAYRGENEIGTELFAAGTDQPVASEPVALMLSMDRYRWTNTGAQVRHEWLLDARAIGSVRLRGSESTLRHTYTMLIDSTSVGGTISEDEARLRERLTADAPSQDLNRISEVAAEGRLSYSFAAHHTAEAGVDVTRYGTHFHLGGQDAPLGRGFRLLDAQEAQWLLAAYVEDRLGLSTRLTAEGGVRLTYVPERQTVYAEPRLALRYDAPRSPLGAISWRLAGGLYRQFINGFDLSTIGPSALMPSARFWLPVDARLAPPRAYHAAAEVLLRPSSQWSVRGEAYYKAQTHLLELNYGVLLNTMSGDEAPDFLAPSDGQAYGAGVQVERRTERTATRFGYSYGHAERRYPGRFGDRRVTTPWNEPHRVTGALDVEVLSGITLQARGQGVWGRAWAFRRAYYDYLVAHNGPDAYGTVRLDTPENDRLTPLVQLDLGARYTRRLGPAQVEIGAAVANVLNRANVLDWSLQPLSDGGFAPVTRTLPGIAPSLSLRITY